MARGRKKNSSNSKNNNGSVAVTSAGTTTPIQTKPKRKFKGKLNHSTNVSPNKMTKYYPVLGSPKSHENSPIISTKLNVVCNVEDNSPVLANKKSVLQETNNISEGSNQSKLCASRDNEINKTESCVLFSPSTALSQLDLNVNEKVSRIKRRLAIDDTTETEVLKSINEQSENSVLKNDPENKLKIDHGSRSHKNQTKVTEFFHVRRSVRKTEKIVLEEKRKNLEKAILSNAEDGLEVRMFEGKGRGVVAAKKFQPGDYVVEYAGELITIEEAKKREELYSRDENTGCYMYYFKHKNNQYCVDATQESNRFGRLLNHSRNGNLYTKTVEVEGIPHLVLMAKNEIEPGCELTYDYGDRSKLSLQYHPWLAQ